MEVLNLYTSDEKIMEGIRMGDHQVYRHLQKTCYPMILQYIVNNTGSREDADDVYQEAVIVLFEKVKTGSFVLSAKLSTYLFSICRFQWLKKLRDSNKEVRLVETHQEFIGLAEEDMAEEEYSDWECMLSDLLSKISENCKKIIASFYLDQLSTKQISDKYGLSGADYVKTQKYRCLQKLKEIAKEQYKIEDISIRNDH